MTDYGKLNEAFVMSKKSDNIHYISCTYIPKYEQIRYELKLGDEEHVIDFLNIDALICELESITQSKTKYKIGDKVYFMSCDEGIGYEEIGAIDGLANE